MIVDRHAVLFVPHFKIKLAIRGIDVQRQKESGGMVATGRQRGSARAIDFAETGVDIGPPPASAVVGGIDHQVPIGKIEGEILFRIAAFWHFLASRGCEAKGDRYGPKYSHSFFGFIFTTQAQRNPIHFSAL